MDNDTSSAEEPAGKPASQPASETASSIRTLVLLSEAGILALAVVLMWWTGLWQDLSLEPGALAIGAAVGIGSAAAVALLMFSGFPGAEGLLRDVQPLLDRFADASLLDLVIIALAAGICEEALFRGAIQSWIGTWTGAHVAVFAGALVFGLVHAVSIRYFVFATALGMVLGYLFLFTGSLAAAMLAHAVYDFVVVYWLRRLQVGPAPEPAGG